MVVTDGTAQTGGAAWWIVALDTPTAWWCAALAATCAVGSAWLLRLAWNARPLPGIQNEDETKARPAAAILSRLRGQTGTATIEFALVFPVLLVMILTLIQTTLVFTGNLFVHYAAFSAARRAVVEVPRSLPGEPVNRVARADSNKTEAVRRAAVFAMLPVSGPGTSSRSSIGGAVDALYRSSGQDPPKWAEELIDSRLGYADAHTTVALARVNAGRDSASDTYDFNLSATGSPDGGDGYLEGQFGPRDAIGVEVRHEFFLSVPFVNRLFSDGRVSDGDSATQGRYAELIGRFILTNEGVADVLPPTPPIPRDDPT